MMILGVRVDNVGMDEAVKRVMDLIASGQKGYVVTPNPEFLVDAQQDDEFRRILNSSDLAIPDGFGLLLASRLVGEPVRARVSGVDLLEKLCKEATSRGWTVFLLGAGEGVAEKVAGLLANKYHNLRVVGYYAGNAEASFDSETLQQIRERLGGQPVDLLFVAFGHRRQEKWLDRNLRLLDVKVGIGVGGAFDFISGRVRRAPACLRRVGLEWLWRLLLEPRRIGRIYKAVVVFPWLVFKEWLCSKLSIW